MMRRKNQSSSASSCSLSELLHPLAADSQSDVQPGTQPGVRSDTQSNAQSDTQSSILSDALPAYIVDNLNPNLPLRPYQIQALRTFCQVSHQANTSQIVAENDRQWLFHMATGSGKTLVMAGCLLALYALGYRRVLFFVNSRSIIEKTRDNFLNTFSSKYLFNKNIIFNNKPIRLLSGERFDNSDPDAMNIIFTTIQGLHSRLQTARENSFNSVDFSEIPTVLLSDEAHHINAETKRQSATKAGTAKRQNTTVASWENTVSHLLQQHPNHCLLEFTATADFNHPSIRKKYQGKLLCDYPLKHFVNEGYAKSVRLLQSDLPPIDSALQAVLLSLHRSRVFADYGKTVKPVILFKSKNIAESRAFYTQFVTTIRTLNLEKIHLLRRYADHHSVMQAVFSALDKAQVDDLQLLQLLQSHFAEPHCLSINSKDDSERKQLLLNHLESPDNPYRVIFAVDMLNEGWDVLNLFDIVRLYDTQSTTSATRKANTTIRKSTLSEAQLIGRGARYYPFQLSPEQPRFQRKFDKHPHPLQIGETLFYHTAHNPSYLVELHHALQSIGLSVPQSDNETAQTATKATTQMMTGAQARETARQTAFSPPYNALPENLRQRHYDYLPFSGQTQLLALLDNDEEIIQAINTSKHKKNMASAKLSDLPDSTLRKAMHRLPFYHFHRLKRCFPSLRSGDEFIHAPQYLGYICFRYPETELSLQEKTTQMDIALFVLSAIQKEL